VGRFSREVFGRDRLPERCLVFAGAYFPGRFKLARKLFDRHTRVAGMWVRYSFAEHDHRRYLLLFNVYGAAMMLEVLYLLKDGGAKSVFFVGSAGSKHLDVGTIVLPTEVVDRAGVVQMDAHENDVVSPPESESESLAKALTDFGLGFAKAKAVSVPAVLHGIGHVTEYMRFREDLEIHEMELSTFYHFAKKAGFLAYALVYVSDNEEHSIVSGEKNVRLARREALLRITKVAQAVLA
jgi:purine-nucleoside phosphorylase